MKNLQLVLDILKRNDKIFQWHINVNDLRFLGIFQSLRSQRFLNIFCFSDEVDEENVQSYYYFMSQLSTLNWTTCIDKLDKLLWKYFFELEKTQWNVV